MKEKIKNPNGLVYYGLFPLPILFIKAKMGIKVIKEKIRECSLILAPHRSYYDIFTSTIAIYPYRAHYIATTYWFRNKALVPLLNIMGTIPRDQYKSDIKSIKKMSDILKANQRIIIYPEGQMSTYGDSLFRPEGLDKFIKKYKPNVYFIHNHGGYLASQKWNPKIAKTKVELWPELLIKKEDLDDLSLEEVNNIIDKAFNDSNDFEWVKNKKDYKCIKKNKAKGLENIISECPKCHKEFSLLTNGLNIKCDSCDFELEFEKNNYNFKENNYFKSLYDLFKYENTNFKEKCNNNLVLEDEARITYFEGYNEVELFEGNVKMDKDFVYLSNNSKTIVIDLNKVINFVITINKSFEIPTSTIQYKIYPKNPKRVILYWNYMQNIKERK